MISPVISLEKSASITIGHSRKMRSYYKNKYTIKICKDHLIQCVGTWRTDRNVSVLPNKVTWLAVALVVTAKQWWNVTKYTYSNSIPQYNIVFVYLV